jgi:hypothetical protein
VTIVESMPSVLGTPEFAVPDEAALLREQVGRLTMSLVDIQESLVDLEMDDRGWTRLTGVIEQEFSPTGRVRIVEVCRVAAISNPLLKRGLTVRAGYIWGQGVEVTARVPGPDGKADTELQDAANQVIDAFEKLNEQTFTGAAARERLEHAEGTDGEVFLAMFTNAATGEVRVRTVPQLQIQQIVCNPEDADEPWFYVREYPLAGLPREGQPLNAPPVKLERVIYPALGFDPSMAGLGFKPPKLNGYTVMWDAPMLHVPVNLLDGWQRGIPDVYASVAWARLYQEFLIDWAGLTKALSKVAWKATGESKSRASAAAAAIRAAQTPPDPTLPGPRTQAGGTAVVGPGTDLTAVSKSGATIDSQSGKPLASMVAAGLGLPVTTLLADPGITGARAVAETLDTPVILEMGMRRLMWQSVMQQILHHALEVAGARPGSPLQVLTGDREPVLEFSWPPLSKLDPLQLVQAIVAADSTGKMPPLTALRLLLQALGVPNVDEVLAEVTDADGNFIDLEQASRQSSGQAAVDKARRGEDPAAVFHGSGVDSGADAVSPPVVNPGRSTTDGLT